MLALIASNVALGFLVVFLAGLLTARLYYFRQLNRPTFPFILIIAGFIVGVLVGNFWKSRTYVLVIFGLGYAISYYLHLKKILVSFKSEDFVK